MSQVVHLSAQELAAGLEHIRQAPTDAGRLELIVCRPEVDGRRSLASGSLDPEQGLAGDNWKSRGSSRRPDGSADPEAQITLMNVRVIALLAGAPERWPLAGDQLYADLDLSEANLPPGTRLGIGSAILEVTGRPHTGCDKFAARFGTEALKFVNSPEGRRLRLRGVHARIVRPGTIRVGEAVKKL